MSHVGRLTRREEAVEGFADGADVSAAHHDLGDVRSARRAFLHEREHFRRVDRVAQLREPIHDAVDPLRPLHPELPQEIAEPRRLVVDEVAEDVDLAARVVRVDLDPGTISSSGWSRATRRAGATASTESWSVRASTRTLRRTASRTSSAGV